MKGHDSMMRRIATKLAAHAAKILPDHRSEWAQAITNEIEHLPDDRAALRWSLGCLLAGYKERMHAMNMRHLQVSGWLLGIEMLLCFAPMSFLGLAVIPATITGNMPLTDALIYLSIAAVGPVGLIVAFRTIVLRRPAPGNPVLIAMCVFAALPIIAFELQSIGGLEALGQSWREAVLLAILPAAGVAHLIYIARRSTRLPQAH